MKQQVDQHHSECHFEEGDQVFLHLQPYKKTSLKEKSHQKLAPKFYGPYTILKHIGPMAYKLALPNHSKLHPVFHVSCLKKVLGSNCRVQTSLPELDEEGSIWLQPEVILDKHEHHLFQVHYPRSFDPMEGYTALKMLHGNQQRFSTNFLISNLEDKATL
jgi:hypothetical protein